MKKKPLFLLLGVSALLCACTSELSPASLPDTTSYPESALVSAVPGTAYLLFSEEASSELERGVYDCDGAALGIKSVERIIPEGGRFDKRHREAGLHRWYKVEYDKLIPATKAAEGLVEMDGVNSVSFPRKIRQCSTPYFNDPGFFLQWNLFNDGTLPSSLGSASYIAGCDINVTEVWERYTTGKSNVTVAVLDGAPNIENKDFTGVVIAPGEHGSKCFVDGYDEYTLIPDNHGSNVCGIIGAINNNSYGTSGVAGGSDGTGGVRMLSCVLTLDDPDDPGSSPFAEEDDILRAYVHAADEGAVICNNSWGYVFDSPEDAAAAAEWFATNDSPIREGIDYFVEYAGYDENGIQTGPMAGGLVVFASDNMAYTHACPAEYNKVMAVGAHGSRYDFASYASYGDWVDIVAPGGNLDSRETEEPYSMILGPGAGKDYYYMQGTSQAAPHVSGVAALLVSYFGGPGFTNEKLWEYLVGGARQNELTGNMDGPVLDAYGSFQYAKGIKIGIATKYRGNYSFKSHETVSIDYTIVGNDTKNLPVTVEAGTKAISYVSDRKSLTVKLEALKDEPGSYPVCIYVGKGTEYEVSRRLTFVILPNNAPETKGTIQEVSLNAEDAASKYVITMSDYFNDPDGEVLSFEVKSEDESVTLPSWTGDKLTLSPKGYGTSRITVKASDARGATAVQTFSVTARDVSRSYDIYPNPVHDILYVRAESSMKTVVSIINLNGTEVLSTEGLTSPSNPLKIDVSSLATGEYTVIVTIGGKVQEGVIIVKY